MSKIATELEREWQKLLETDSPQLKETVRNSIVRWLLGPDLERFDDLPEGQRLILEQGMEYRYRILRQRYLGVPPDRAYRHLISRLGSLVVLSQKIRTWVSLSRDRHRAVADVLQEIIQEMLQSDRNIQASLTWIAQCTTDPQLRNALLLASVEEYSLRPIRHQPLLAFRFVNYLRRSQRGGLTQVPQQERLQILSEDLDLEDGESSVSLFDSQAVTLYQETQTTAEQQSLRQSVAAEFAQYLNDKLEPLAAEWLKLYLQGKSQEAIAKTLNVPIKQVYRLREKVSYHAVKIFALKGRPELVANWLQTSLVEHNLGLTLGEWENLWGKLTPMQQQIVTQLKLGGSLEVIAKQLGLKTSQLMTEWHKIYESARAIRSHEEP